MVNLRKNAPTGSSGGADVAGRLYGLENGVFGISDLTYKSIVLKARGTQLYRKRQPFFYRSADRMDMRWRHAYRVWWAACSFSDKAIWHRDSERGVL